MSKHTKAIISEGEYYHVFNRGVDKRDIFIDKNDLQRFLQSMEVFNDEENSGSIYETRYKDKDSIQLGSPTPKLDRKLQSNKKLVEFIAYCLNPNHFHFIVKSAKENGLQKFMQKLGTGYTNYFNEKYKRSGSLFQGKYKRVLVLSNEQLLHLSAYVNLNNKFSGQIPKLSKSSWEEYIGKISKEFCDGKEIIIGQFKNKTDYEKYATSSLEDILKRKMEEKVFEKILID